jgi:serine/threonine protein kinase
MKFLKGLFRKKPKIEKVDLTRRFDLISQVGTGSMSTVWRARDTMTGKIVALKVLDPVKTRRFEARFVGLNKPTEGEAAVQMQHPNIVHAYECGVTVKGEQFLVMEYIEGVGLSFLVDTQNEVMQRNRLQFMVQFGNAVDYIHRNEWIHRDICPRNVLLDVDYQVKLIDFGLVVPCTDDFRKPGNRTGTANYMAPELIKRLWTDQRVDVFAFTVSCYEMLTKRLPWHETGISLEMVLQHINNPPDDIREVMPDVDEQLAETMMKGLAADPDRRWQSMSEMLVPLREVRNRLEGDEDEDENDEYEDVDQLIQS